MERRKNFIFSPLPPQQATLKNFELKDTQLGQKEDMIEFCNPNLYIYLSCYINKSSDFKRSSLANKEECVQFYYNFTNKFWFSIEVEIIFYNTLKRNTK